MGGTGHEQGVPRPVIVAALVCVLAVGGVVALVATDVIGAEDSAGLEVGATLREVARDPERFLGEVVQVSGRVERVVPDDADEPLGLVLGDEVDADLLVVAGASTRLPDQALDEPLDDDARLRVTGVLRRVGADEGPSLPPAVRERFADEPVLVASEAVVVRGIQP